MRKLRKWITAIAVIFWMGIATQANAVIELRSGYKGDALLFPVFAGTFENYFTIMNDVRDSSPVDDFTSENNHWIQGHLRFRGAAWSGELLDIDVILSPNDVLVFRIADVDGDGLWELDQSLDPKNFQYTGSLSDCFAPNVPPGGTTPPPAATQCADQSSALIPPIDTIITKELIGYQQTWGYVEFIAEGVLSGMTHPIMDSLIDPANKGLLAAQGQKKLIITTDEAGNLITFGGLGTHLWSWTSMAGNNGPDRGATDVGNVLSGTAFITILPGSSHGLAYNAEALYNFRTTTLPVPQQHRIDNYPPDTGVILHDEDVSGPRQGTSPIGDYLYGYPFNPGSTKKFEEDRLEEAQLSFSGTWGPTLADGDDYNPIPTEDGVGIPMVAIVQDPWDVILSHANVLKGANNINSITEVEEAIRLFGQRYVSFFFDGEMNNLVPGMPMPLALAAPAPIAFDAFDSACQGNGNTFLGLVCSTISSHSWYVAFLPTKYFYGISTPPLSPSFSSYLTNAVHKLVGSVKVVGIDVWDTKEKSCRWHFSHRDDGEELCSVSPCAPSEWDFCIDVSIDCKYWIPYESSLFKIDDVKSAILVELENAKNTIDKVVITDKNGNKHPNPPPAAIAALAKAKALGIKSLEDHLLFIDGIPRGKFALWPHVDLKSAPFCHPPYTTYDPFLSALPVVVPAAPVSSVFNQPVNPPQVPGAALTAPLLMYTFEMRWPMALIPDVALVYHWRQMQR